MKNKFLLLSLTCASLSAAGEVGQITNQPNTNSLFILPRADNLPYFELDFIYWAARQAGNAYAATGNPQTVPGTTDTNGTVVPALTSAGKIYEPEIGGKPGFKVALGVNLEYDSWDLYVDYTFLYGKDTSSITNNSQYPGIYPLFMDKPNNSIVTKFESLATLISSAKSDFEFQYNNMHLELAKSIPLFTSFVLNPHFGLQGAWIRQHGHTTYEYATYNSKIVVGGQQLHYAQQFWGIGPTVGVDGIWQCIKHLGFFGKTSLAALWGTYDAVTKTFETNGYPGMTNYKSKLISDNKYEPTTLSPVMELSLGLSSDWMITSKYRMLFTIAWDAQVWFAHGQHSILESAIPNTDLFFQGLTTGFRFDF